MSKITAVQLDAKDATSIVISAIEGGTNYWAECKGYKWSSWYVDVDAKYGEENYDKLREIPRDEVLVYIREDADQVDPEDGQNWFGITIENLEKAMCTALAEYSHLYTFRDGEIDTDATGADVVFQLAKFGNVVYG
jgi:hypothetical protein